MKKKFRTITVKDIQYGWIVKNMGSTLEIFKDKKLIHSKDLKNNFNPVTPKLVKETILKYCTNL